MPAQASTLVDLFLSRVSQTPDQTALRFHTSDAVRKLTWQEISEDVHRIVGCLLEAGIRPGDRVAQLSENRYEWILVDFAILLVQGVHVPIHAPLAGEQVEYQVRHSGARLLFVSGTQQQIKVESVANTLPPDLILVSFDAQTGTLARRPLLDFHDWVHSRPSAAASLAAQQAREQTTSTSLATILYTSGTTGQPKGVMLSHGNLVSNASSMAEMFGMSDDDVRLNFLPLSHIFARTCDLYTWLVSGAELCLATSRESVLSDCQWAKPTILSGVPYFFDRVYRVLKEHGAEKTPDGLRNLLGGKIQFCCSGGAALPDHVFDLYDQHGIPILQGYGLTETSPVISLSSPDAYRRGSSGRALPDVDVKIADDGEIVSRGPHIMLGYWQEPEATAEVLIDDWFHTGDLGEVDADGYIYITGRKKELIVTAAGKNVTPVLLESLLIEDPLIDQALVIGDGRNYLTALIVPDWDAVRAELPGLADEPEDADLRRDNDVQALFHRQIEYRLARVSYHEQVRRFTLLSRPFSLEQQEMTPKLSLRRPIIHDHFQSEIEAMYRK